MEEMHDYIKERLKSKNGKVEFEGLMILDAKINGIGRSYKDVLGWDVTYRYNGKCYEFYCAQSPLEGLTQPIEVPCRYGIKAFDSYKVDFKEALEKMKEIDCGDKFVAMGLSWPLTPECKEPYWHIKTTLGNQISIGANSGTVECHKR